MIELLCTDYNKKATSIHYYFGNAVLAMVTNSRIPITNIWYYVGQDGKWYCFDRNNGDMKRGTTIDGYTVDFILAGFREKELCAD
ncbi:hypothetical protein [Enterocloster clostridioformis]|uniref:hypothetical protein n=1 Tax=Enterocloster clostridioformis TaxID=1531 RepID=UPI0032C1B346